MKNFKMRFCFYDILLIMYQLLKNERVLSVLVSGIGHVRTKHRTRQYHISLLAYRGLLDVRPQATAVGVACVASWVHRKLLPFFFNLM